jgi:hypothetical protein
MLPRILSLLETCTTDSPVLPPTLLYNEGWLLRLVLDWFSTHPIPNHPLSFSEDARWFSEALLPSAFLARCKGDPLAEGWTHADGVIGHLKVGHASKADLSLLPDATQLVVLEAKLSSGLSKVKNAPFYNQVARSVACMAEVLKRAERRPSEMAQLGFHVLAPQSWIASSHISAQADRKAIMEKVERRVQAYGGEKDSWYADWFQPTIEHIKVGVLPWEDIVRTIKEHEPSSSEALRAFYVKCLELNKPYDSKSSSFEAI